MNRDYTFEKGVNDLTDEFSEEEDIQSEITKAPKLVELGEEDNDDNIREFISCTSFKLLGVYSFPVFIKPYDLA